MKITYMPFIAIQWTKNKKEGALKGGERGARGPKHSPKIKN